MKIKFDSTTGSINYGHTWTILHKAAPICFDINIEFDQADSFCENARSLKIDD
jgi:hypothetical protein